MSAAAILLPAGEAEISRLDSGTLRYRWQSPCEALGFLNAYIDEYAIMLSTKISHTHLEGWQFRQGSLSEEERAVRIIANGITSILEIFDGEIVFTREFDSSGKALPSGGMSPRHIWLDPPSDTPSLKWLAENGRTQRAWDWFGEVRRPEV